MRRAVDLLGGIKKFVHPGDHVLLKPNLLSARPPERRVTTDPRMVMAVARLVREAGGDPFMGDSPALESFTRVAAKTGMAEMAHQLGIPLVPFTRPIRMTTPAGSLFKKLEIAPEALEANVVINLPKLKTHSQMLLTLGVKKSLWYRCGAT